MTEQMIVVLFGCLISVLLTVLITSVQGMRKDLASFKDETRKEIKDVSAKADSGRERVIKLEEWFDGRGCLDRRKPCPEDSSPPIAARHRA